MVRYEALFLTVPEITVDELADIETRLQKTVSEVNGKTLSFERWGKYLLAYPVRKHEYGVYVLTRFELPEEDAQASLEKIRALLAVRFNNTVMRHIFNALDPKGSLEYRRPESLEEAPRREEGGERSPRGGFRGRSFRGEGRGEHRGEHRSEHRGEHRESREHRAEAREAAAPVEA